ncbi:hypothetical protein BATDEDRAFT_26447 [Batrachochytrium dendrobatidis JAM81]|uniref:Uncharacterized protein n=2 Tax=Batrachochytrium dendrobatidis TaxID=109871 RepID=F4P8F8_BATDJ|nr:uncharacterized protein BATDEDRAFT_26447 [Batrachochytrium dendrobatidis JAM81]EGF78428.1 hypothetical protein BATDEDRAFT_26447 [Batrachochytrium dendrobatidis JAM81]KAJ8324216.1 hypothetical protein O5D80_007413 [Batrachochytrium dendrobatidis]KAK5665010.1 hypothetical protein QVD99_008544 [Batrachochytrium dendrobatidis]OAJ43412.1 hypothetical protein BDEG_26774 [Batrachochytrium dendrobatidis JEL423]|eukprot:XP_006680671.1 hypothetical protein BATDEDRAFT_26447 [Batrachochytrium dendrobatidis JAM81]
MDCSITSKPLALVETFSDSHWKQHDLLPPSTSSHPPPLPRTIVRPAPSVTIKRKGQHKKPLDQCSLAQLEQMLKANTQLLHNQQVLQSLPDQGKALEQTNKDIQMWLEKRQKESVLSQTQLSAEHSQSESTDITLDYLDTRMQSLNVTDTPLPIILTKRQVRDQATCRAGNSNSGRMGHISLAESIDIQNTRRQIIETQRLNSAMEKLRKSASIASLTSEFFKGNADSSASLGEFMTGANGYRDGSAANSELDFNDDLSDLSFEDDQ